MRTKIILITIIMAFCFVGIQAQENMFEKLSNHKDITTVYISKSLLKMMPNMEAGGADIKGLAGKLEQLEIYNSEGNNEAAKMMKQEVSGLVKLKTYEILMKVKEQDNNVTFYAHKEKDRIRDLIMFVDESNNCTIIRIKGDFSTEDIQNVMDGTKNEKK